MLLGEQDSSSDVEVEEFRDLVRKRSDIEKKMDHIDEEAKQVWCKRETRSGIAKSMADCYSNRASDCPLQTSIELKCLATGSSIAAFSIRNTSKFDLKGWSISVSISPTTPEVSCSYSQSAALIHLAPGEVFTSELFFPNQYLHLPVLFHLKLTRMFYIQNEAKYICVNLDDEFLSLRDQIYQVDTPLPAVDRELSNVLGSFTLQLPCCLVDLLAGCPDNDDPVNALRVLLPTHRFQSLPAATSSTDALLVLNQSQKHLLRMMVTKERSFFIVTVTLRDSTLRNRLRQALQVHVIHTASRILKRPSSNPLSIINCSTLNELYDSVILSFST